jgi:enamine deaminase RidA (YjgF/YER057c/UK114 family)
MIGRNRQDRPSMSRNVIVPEANRRAYEGFHFAPGVRAGNLVILSGQIGLDPTGNVPESAEEEFRNAWRAIGQTLAHAGLDYANIIEYTTFHVGLQANLPTFMKVRDEFISEPWPAWTAIGITELAVPGARVEIRVIAEHT